jgi:hypothetical protein
MKRFSFVFGAFLMTLSLAFGQTAEKKKYMMRQLMRVYKLPQQ